MNDEYDFSKAERGKFCRPGARLVPPVHLKPHILADLIVRAVKGEAPLSRGTITVKDDCALLQLTTS